MVRAWSSWVRIAAAGMRRCLSNAAFGRAARNDADGCCGDMATADATARPRETRARVVCERRVAADALPPMDQREAMRIEMVRYMRYPPSVPCRRRFSVSALHSGKRTDNADADSPMALLPDGVVVGTRPADCGCPGGSDMKVRPIMVERSLSFGA